MTAGVGFLGREVDFSFGGATILGVVSKSLAINNSPVDTSDDDSQGWAEYLAEPGRKDVTLGLSLKVKNLSLVQAALQTGSQIYATTLTFPDGSNAGSRITGDVFLNSVSPNGEHEGLFLMDIELTYSGPVTFTAAT